MKLKKIQEGKVNLLVPDSEVYSSPEESPVFYNPLMEFDRSLSIEVAREFFKGKKEEIEVLDALSATGVRALRYSKELGAKAVANDTKEVALELMEKNIGINPEVDVRRSRKDANALFHEKGRYDFIDIDPFGSPTPYVRNSFKAINRKRGLLAVTATDLGALSGHYPKTCFRRYCTTCRVNPWEHEVGLRNLIYSVFLSAAQEGFAVDPVMSYWKRHYYRAFFYVRKSKRWVNRNLCNVGFVGFCVNCGRRKVNSSIENMVAECKCGKKMKIIGPTWIGYLSAWEFVRNVGFPDPLLSRIKEDSRIKELHYDTHRMASVLGSSLKKKDDCIERLTSKGYKASETMFTGHGFKTNAPKEVVLEILKE